MEQVRLLPCSCFHTGLHNDQHRLQPGVWCLQHPEVRSASLHPCLATQQRNHGHSTLKAPARLLLQDAIVTTLSGPFRSQKLLRVTRISRMLKLIKSFRSLQSLFVTLWISLPAFWNVGALLILIMFMYSYLGVQLMGNVRHGAALGYHANFERLWIAMPTLFRYSLGLMMCYRVSVDVPYRCTICSCVYVQGSNK